MIWMFEVIRKAFRIYVKIRKEKPKKKDTIKHDFIKSQFYFVVITFKIIFIQLPNWIHTHIESNKKV